MRSQRKRFQRNTKSLFKKQPNLTIAVKTSLNLAKNLSNTTSIKLSVTTKRLSNTAEVQKIKADYT
jgi:hypothetical protein